MAYQEVSTGDNPPSEVNVLIEMQKGGGLNKYEMDKKTGRLTLDRVNSTTSTYPADYGYIPGTLCGDGDPLDAMLIIDEPVVHGAVVPARPIGILYMVDDGEDDEKIVCVARDDISKDHVKEIDDYDPHLKKRFENFYKNYKAWKNDWKGTPVEYKGWGNSENAKKFITESMDRYKKS